MRPLRYSINVTLDGCCDHRAIIPDEELYRHAVENLSQADALLFGRVTYEMMEAAFRPPAPAGARPDWMEPFARTIDAAKKYVVSSTLDRVDWNAELVRGDLGKAVQQLKEASGKGLFGGQALRRGAQEGEAGVEVEGVDSAAHQVCERAAAGELVADGGDDFFVAADAQGYGVPGRAGWRSGWEAHAPRAGFGASPKRSSKFANARRIRQRARARARSPVISASAGS